MSECIDSKKTSELTESDPSEDKSYELMKKGQILNKSDRYNQEAFDLLTKSIKLNPNLIESWLELAECYQKRADFDGAIVCLESALKNCDKPSNVVLRNLSACIRQKPVSTPEAKLANPLKSLELSKEALKLDLKDPLSYYNLAKAYMCLFFASECVDESLIRMSRSAFEKVLSSNDVSCDPGHSKDTTSISDGTTKPLPEQSDFLFNYATVLIYTQDFQLAINYLEDASKIEPSWSDPKNLLDSLVDYLRQINVTMNDITKNAKKSSRRYKKVVDNLMNVSQIEKAIVLDEQRLRKCASVVLKTTSIKNLINDKSLDLNPGQVSVISDDKEPVSISILHIKLLFTINYNQAMYLTFIAIDKDYSFTVVTIHNLSAKNSPSNRDVITIVEPKMDNIDVKFRNSKEFITYNRINIKKFKDFYINGRRISIDQVAKPQIKVSTLTTQEVLSTTVRAAEEMFHLKRENNYTGSGEKLTQIAPHLIHLKQLNRIDKILRQELEKKVKDVQYRLLQLTILREDHLYDLACLENEIKQLNQRLDKREVKEDNEDGMDFDTAHRIRMAHLDEELNRRKQLNEQLSQVKKDVDRLESESKRYDESYVVMRPVVKKFIDTHSTTAQRLA